MVSKSLKTLTREEAEELITSKRLVPAYLYQLDRYPRHAFVLVELAPTLTRIYRYADAKQR